MHDLPTMPGLPRSCRLEVLERRVLLSVTCGYEQESISSPPDVDAAWFGDLVPRSEVEAWAVTGESQSGAATQDATRQATELDQSATAVRNRWIVQLTTQAVDRTGSAAGAKDVLHHGPSKTRVVRGLGIEGMLLLQAEPGVDPVEVEAWLSGNPLVAYWEPDAPLGLTALPDDVDFHELWGLNNTGQSGGRADADIDGPEAWDLTTGSRSVVIGVMDTGTDYTHPDLAANIWTNPGEVPDNGIDDDGNGFVDDVHGYDFVNGDGDPIDDNGHGTHVAGTIAAVGNNGQGVTGVNWTGSLMVLKFLDEEGDGYSSDAALALNYATLMRSTYDVNVRLTNNSWGGGDYSQALFDSIRASGNAGMLFVSAAGNKSSNTDKQPYYPSTYDLSNILSVAAVDNDDRVALFSNYGPTSVDLAAPGVDVYSTKPDGEYGLLSGTSMATPHVSGVAALAWSLSPNASRTEIRGALLDGVDVLDSLNGKVATSGRLNAYNTLRQLSMGVASGDPADQSIVSTAYTEFSLWFTHAYDPDSVDPGDLTVNGAPADSVILVDPLTVTFQFDHTPLVAEGPQEMEIAAGSLLRASDAGPVNAWQSTFFYDTLTMAVSSTVPADGYTLEVAPAEIVLNFNEAVDAESVDAADLSLDVGTVTAATLLDSDSIAYSVSDLPREGDVNYRLSAGSIRDVHGTPGPAYTAHFTIDDPLTTQYRPDDVPKSIIDYDTISSVLVVDESYAIADLDVRIDISHNYDGDLDVLLVAPDGTTIELFSDVGGSGDGFEATILDDEANTPIGDGTAPFRGRYQPQQPLASVDGLDVMGSWTLEVSDDGGMDEGTLNDWSLIVKRGAELPPRIRAVDPLPPDGGQIWGQVDSLTVLFSKEMEVQGISAGDNWQLREAGVDGAFDSPDDVDYALAVDLLTDGLTAELDILDGPLPPGNYRFWITGQRLTDLSGKQLDGNRDGTEGGDYLTHFVVAPGNWYPAPDLPKEIADNGTTTSWLTIDDSYPIADLDVNINVSHSYDGDLDIYLVAPNGTSIELFTDVGSGGDGFLHTVLDDEAETRIGDGQAPFSGRYQPEGMLSVVDGTNVLGTWVLKVSDDSQADEGVLQSWALIFERGPDIPPEIDFVDPLPADGGQIWGPLDELRIGFSKAMSPDTVSDLNNWELLEAGGDGLFDTADDVPQQLTVLSSTDDWSRVSFTPKVGILLAGDYRFTADSGGLADTFGNLLDGNRDGVGGDGYRTHFTILPGYRYSAADLPKEIVDNGTISLRLDVDTPFVIGDLDVHIDVVHTYDADLDLYLVAPDGTRIELFTDVGRSGDNFSGTILDDQAEKAIYDGEAPFDGRYRPEGSLSVVEGMNALGTWTLEITDDAGRDLGTINSWALRFDPGLPEPPRITGQMPGDSIVGPLEHILLYFDREMDQESFSPSEDIISLLGPEGEIVVTGHEWDDPTTLRIAFDPQSAPGNYTIVVAPEILDLTGNPLDQDEDSQPGEPIDDQYTSSIDLIHPLGTIESLELLDLDPSNRGLWFQFQVARPGLLTLEAEHQGPIGDLQLQLYDENRGEHPLAVSASTARGLQRIDWTAQTAGETYYLKIVGSSTDVDVRLVNLLSRDGGTVTILGTSDDDLFEFDGAGPYQVMINGVRYEFDPAEVSSLSFAGGDGADSALLQVGNLEASVDLWPDRGEITGQGYSVVVTETESTTVIGSGTGSANLYASPTEDIFEASPEYAFLEGTGFSNRVESFPYVNAYATDAGDDIANLYDNPTGKDFFVATPQYGNLYGQGYAILASSFRYLHAHATEGDGDAAKLYDDPHGKDIYLADPGIARLYSDSFYIRCLDFDRTDAFATEGGGDTAKLYDDPDGVDTLIAWPAYGKLTGDGFLNRAVGFDLLRAYATEGHKDIAYMYSGDEKDVVETRPKSALIEGDGFSNKAVNFFYTSSYGSSGNVATMHGSNEKDSFVATPTETVLYNRDYCNRTYGIGTVQAIGYSGNDLAKLYGEADTKETFVATLDTAELYNGDFSNKASGFKYVHGYSNGGGDVAKFFDGSTTKEIFHATPDYSTFYNDDVTNRVVGFRYVHAYSTGGGDVAKLFDDPKGKDTFVATPEYGTFYGNEFFNRALDFAYVHAFSTPGNDDVATLYDDPNGIDTFIARPDFGKMTGDGFYNRALSFAKVKAYATPGGGDQAYLYDSALADYPDTLDGNKNWARLSNDALGYAYWAYDFGQVEANSSNSSDNNNVDPDAVDFLLYADGEW